MPVGRGKKFVNTDSRILNFLIGGWNLSAALQYRSGVLNQISTPGNPLGNGVLTGIDKSTLDPGDTSIRYYNSGANAPFVAAPRYTLGSSALYNTHFRRPMVKEENFFVSKRFRWDINDTRSIDFIYRADIFNAFNRTNFNVNASIGNANFGSATAPQSCPRIITMGLRLDF